MSSPPSTPHRHDGRGATASLGRLALLSASYFLAAQAGSVLSVPNSFTTFWPPGGLLLAVLLRAPVRTWPAIALSVLPANLAFDVLHGRPALLSGAYWVANSLEALAGAALLRRFAGVPLTFARLKDVAGIALLAAIGSTLLGASLGAAATIAHQGTGSYWQLWQLWWTSDALGILLVAPVILTWGGSARALQGSLRRAEWVGFLSAIALVAGGLIANASVSPPVVPAFPLVVFPLLGWAVLRFGPRGVATCLLAIASTVLWNYVHGRGFFSAGGPLTACPVAVLQTFLGAIAVTFLGLAAGNAERVDAMDARRRSETGFRMVADSAPVVMWMADLEGNCEFTNRAWTTLTGQSSEDAVGTGWLGAVHPAEMESVRAQYRAAAQEARPVSVEYRYRHVDGEWRWILATGRPCLGAGDACVGYVGSAIDITDRKNEELERQRKLFQERAARQRAVHLADELTRLNTELADARHAAQEDSRLKSGFLAKMSHEIRTPMTAILGYADLLSDTDVSDGERTAYLDTIRHQGTHLLHVISDILDISRIEAGKLTVERIPCSPIAVAQEVALLMAPLALERDLTFHTEYDDLVPDRILSDPVRLRQILINLAGNAVKFTEAGGVRLRVRASDCALGGRPAVSFDVIDTGPGISPETQARLFVPFSQGEVPAGSRAQGSGLGLAIAKSLAELLGGGLRVESRAGAGSTFVLSVGAQLSQTVAAEHERDAIEGVRAGSRVRARRRLGTACRVLLAEDAPDTQRLLALFLRKAGAEVHTAEDGLSAYELALKSEAAACPFDVVLLDMEMPVQSGYDTAIQLRRAGYTRPIVALTAHAMVGEREKCLRAGCDDFATKPIARDALLGLVERHLRGEAGGPGREMNDAALARTSRAAENGEADEVTAGFVAGLPRRASSIERALAAGDLKAVGRAAHQLKGTAALFGFLGISRAAADVEAGARAPRDSEGLRQHVRRVSDLCRSLSTPGPSTHEAGERAP